MPKITITHTMLLCALLLAACTSKLDFLSEVIAPKTAVETVTIAGEAFSLVSYRTGNTKNPIPIYFIGGSGCTSLRAYMGTYFSQAPKGLEIIALEKTGTRDRSIGTRCSRVFWENYTYDELLRRNKIALSLVLQRSGKHAVPMIGTSEGGTIALELAAKTNAVQRLAIIGAGAMTQRQELRKLYGAQTIKDAFESVANNPQGINDRPFGQTNRYWSSVLDRDPKRYIKRVSAPTVIIIGENDRNVPVASAYLANDLIRNSRLIIWPDATHTFDTPNGNQRKEVVETAIKFLINESPFAQISTVSHD